MLSQLKILVITVLAIAGMGLTTASAAQAVEFAASSYPATITGTNTKAKETISTEGGNIECATTHLISHSIAAKTSTATFTPTYLACQAFGFLEANVSAEGCSYVFHGTEPVSAGVNKHHVDISCPTGKSIKVVAGTCAIEFKGQSNLTTAKSTNSGSSFILNWELSSIAYTVTQDGFLCPFGGTGNKTDGKYTGQMTMSRFGGGTASVVHETTPGTGEFTTSSYPFSITGSNTKGSEVLTTEGGKQECNSHYVSHLLGEASSTMTITPTWTSCESFGFLSATVNTEECSYLFHATEEVSSGVYKHHVDISCPAGRSIKTTASSCKMEIKPQSGLTTVKSTNTGTSITLNWEISNLAYTVTQDGFLCPFGGTGNKTGATYTGQTTFSRVGGGSVSVSG